MLTSPSHILCPPNIGDPDFPAKYMAWTAQIRSEINETVALTRKILAECRGLLKEADRVLARNRPPQLAASSLVTFGARKDNSNRPARSA
jgi:hypothetical protein